MMRTIFCFLAVFTFQAAASAQGNQYRDSVQDFRETYVIKHEVVQGEDKNFFRFFQINDNYRVAAVFEKIMDTVGFVMKTSGTKDKKYFRYGRLRFMLHNSQQQLTVYQSEQLMYDSVYKDYLFVPFTDLTSGKKSYGGGRYIDFDINDFNNSEAIIDFNKAYNPYCAYSTGFNCPIPPRENNLSVRIEAGEKKFKGEVKSRK